MARSTGFRVSISWVGIGASQRAVRSWRSDLPLGRSAAPRLAAVPRIRGARRAGTPRGPALLGPPLEPLPDARLVAVGAGLVEPLAGQPLGEVALIGDP